MSRRLVLLRHGRTSWNASGRFQGQADPALDEIGVAQARRAGAALARLGPCRIVTSDLKRARATADIVAAACGGPAGGPTAEPALREVALGAWEGLATDEARRRFPVEHAAWTEGADVRRGGGETQREAGERAAAALVTTLDNSPREGTLIAVSHGLVLRAAVHVLVENGLFDLDGDAPHLDNGDWLVLAAHASAPARANLMGDEATTLRGTGCHGRGRQRPARRRF